MNLKKTNFFKRLKLFVENVQVNDAMSEEEKDFILRACDNQHVLKIYDATYGSIFYDEDNNIITAIHENDGHFRTEYFAKLFTHFNIKVEKSSKRPEFLTDKILIEYGVEEEN